MEEAEARIETLANDMAKLFNKYVKKQQKRNGFITMPALLNVCTRLVVGAVRTFPPAEQDEVIKEFAKVLAHRYRLAGVSTPEESKIIVRH